MSCEHAKFSHSDGIVTSRTGRSKVTSVGAPVADTPATKRMPLMLSMLFLLSGDVSTDESGTGGKITAQ